MKRVIATLLICGFAMPALAQPDVQLMNQKADELDLAQEIEEVERYGEDAASEVSKTETARLSRESNQLERDIVKMKRANGRAQDKSKQLAALYLRKARMAEQIRLQANKAEKEKNRAEAEVARLQSKVESKEQQTIKALDKRKAAETRAAQLKREKKQLELRLVAANKAVQRNEAQRRAAHMRAVQLAKQNAKLQRQVVRAETRSARF